MASQIRRFRPGGFALLELVLALGVIAVGVLAVLASISFSSRLSHMDRETALAMETSEAMLAAMRSVSFGDLYDQYGPGGTDTFSVTGLTPRTPGAAPGSITLFVNETVSNPSLELPRDLNGDGDAADADVSGGYLLLPVRLRVEWIGSTGPRSFDLYSLMANR